MPETVTLTGDALLGVHAPLGRRLAAQLPQRVCLGRNRPKALPQALQLKHYLTRAAAPPASINRRDKAAASLARVYLNDRYGDCVFAGKAHLLGVLSANDPDSGGEVQATDAEIQKQYFDYTGGRDNGADIAEVLNIMRSKGFLAGGKYYKIDGYAAVDHTNRLLVQIVQYLFGASSIGINLPAAWTSSAVWDVTSTRIVGGHDVTPIDYDDKGVYVSSWGRVYLITWAAFQSTRWVEEMYAVLAPLWYNADKLAPSGLDAAALLADLAKLSHGELPDIGPTPPPAPPPAPPPGLKEYHCHILAAAPPVWEEVAPKSRAIDWNAIEQLIAFIVTLFQKPHAALLAVFARFNIPEQAVPFWVQRILAALADESKALLSVLTADMAAGKTYEDTLADLLAALLRAEAADAPKEIPCTR